MMSRYKQNREPLERRRERSKKLRRMGKGASSMEPAVSIEQMEQIDKQIKAWEVERERRTAKIMLICGAVILALAVIVILFLM